MSDMIEELSSEAGLDPAAQMLQRYDPVARTWNVEAGGELWQAVDLAHRMGRFGQSRRIAVIDGAFDVSLPALAEQTAVWDAEPGAPTSHGSVAALLILAVAPRAELLLYPIRRNGRLDPSLAAAAVTDAVDRGVDVINLSIGRAVPIAEAFDITRFIANAPFDGDASRDDIMYWAAQHSLTIDIQEGLAVERDELATATQMAAAAGVAVIAAVGNGHGSIFAPALFPETYAVGFVSRAASLDDGFEVVEVGQPTFTQAVLVDFTLVQPAGVLGSSFATPLMSGFVSLMADLRELPAMREAVRRSGWATTLWREFGKGEWRPDRHGVIDELFKRSVNDAPHHHHWTQARYPCPECSFHLMPAYNNAGLCALEWGDLAKAQVLFTAPTWFSPHRHEPPANLAVTLGVLADRLPPGERAATLAQAVRESATSLAHRPGYEPYRVVFADLCERLAAEFALVPLEDHPS